MRVPDTKKYLWKSFVNLDNCHTFAPHEIIYGKGNELSRQVYALGIKMTGIVPILLTFITMALHVHTADESMGNEFNEFLKKHGPIKIQIGAEYTESGAPYVTVDIDGTKKWLTLLLTAAMIEDKELYMLLRSSVSSYETSVLSEENNFPEHMKKTVRAILLELGKKSAELIGAIPVSGDSVKFSVN